MSRVIPVLLILFFIAKAEERLMCYGCHQTSDACQYGYVDELQKIYCSFKNSVCATYKYESSIKGYFVKATIRGCEPVTSEGICNKLMTSVCNKKGEVIKRGVYCNTCNTTLCNYSSSSASLSNIVTLNYLVIICLYFPGNF